MEEVWEPEDDPDAGLSFPFNFTSLLWLKCYLAKSFEELGLRALGNLPREKAIDGIVAYNKLRCVLVSRSSIVHILKVSQR